MLFGQGQYKKKTRPNTEKRPYLTMGIENENGECLKGTTSRPKSKQKPKATKGLHHSDENPTSEPYATSCTNFTHDNRDIYTHSVNKSRVWRFKLLAWYL